VIKTKLIKVDPHSPDENSIEFAATLLRDGRLVAFPTETVYGIGANFMNKEAIKRLYEIKNRPLTKPFTIHIATIDMIGDMQCEIPPIADRLMKRFWPGPLTLVLKGKGGKVGFRMPKNAVAKELISKSGVPLAVPSANISGEKPPTGANDVLKKLNGKIDLVLDGGNTEFGRESTVIDAAGDSYKILRKGAIPENEIDEALSDEDLS
jgi:L-threonylcarbamoyladenylate synthase